MTGGLRAFHGFAAAAALTFGGVTGARGQEVLPSAQQIIARYHEAMGVSSLEHIESMYSIGELALPAMGITGTLEIWQGRPNRTVLHASIPGFGEVRTGFSGKNGWSLDPAAGARILTGGEAVQAKDDAHFDSHLRTTELVDSMMTLERTTLSGYECHKVRTVWKSGRETIDCFSVETGLLVGSMRTHQAATGPAEALILYEEYRKLADVMLPTRITTRVNGVDQIITLQKVTLNQVHDSVFVPPPEIRRLLDG